MKWSWKSPWIWGALILIGVILFIVIYFSVKGSEADPGMAWKVPYSAYPELQEIYETFKRTCVIPAIPKAYFDEIKITDSILWWS